MYRNADAVPSHVARGQWRHDVTLMWQSCDNGSFKSCTGRNAGALRGRNALAFD